MSGGAGGEAGNYKGVMLCNRPAATAASGPAHLTPSIDAPSFRPVGLPAEPLGLNPAKENLVSNVVAVHEEAARRRHDNPNAVGTNFMNKHRQWLSDMARKKSQLNQELQASAQAAEQKRTKFVAYTKSLRVAVRERAAEMDELGIEYAAPRESKRPAPPMSQRVAEPEPEPSAPPPPPKPPTPPPKPKAPKPAAKGGSAKPAWAMTEGEAEDADDLEASELLEFASGLDYDSYIDDLEVRQALTVIRERIDLQNAMASAAQAAEEAAEGGALDDDWRSQFLSEWNGDPPGTGGGSQAGDAGATRRAATGGGGGVGERDEWDASTNAGDNDHRKVPDEARAMAEEMLASHPGLAAKHSVRSLSAVVDKQKRLGLGMGEEELPPLRVVTIVENPRKPEKVIDASNLPYLHRNPAI